ncbi:MAG: glycosyltransferase family 9 protein [Alphaproteobacteria bacterium]
MSDDPMIANARRAVSFEREGKFFEAESLYRQLVQKQPLHPMSHYLFGNFKLLMGAYEEAWPYFQRRLEDEFYLKKGTMNFPQPFWDGSEQPDKTLLIHVDQGIGDAILCARYIPAAADRVRQVILAAHPRMGRFFGSVDSRIKTVEIGDSVPDFDVHVDIFSLPPIFGATLEAIPQPPYLDAEPDIEAEWKGRLDGPEFRVGLAWQGNPENARDKERSMKLMDLEPLLRTPGVKFYGLQVGTGAEQVKDLPSDIAFEDLAADTMVDTAGAVANLDLVISVDSALAHLSAAMGRPTWVPSCAVPDWRWLRVSGDNPLSYENAPWYPGVRVFRKRERYDWSAPVARMSEALSEEAERTKRT